MLPRHSDPTISGNACPTTSITGQCKLAVSRTTSPRAVGPASKVTSKVFAENPGCWNFTLYEPGSTVENANLPWLSVLTSTVVELDRVIVVLVIAAPRRSITVPEMLEVFSCAAQPITITSANQIRMTPPAYRSKPTRVATMKVQLEVE